MLLFLGLLSVSGSVCSLTPIVYAWRDISSRSWGISMKLGTGNRHLNGHCWKVYKDRGQRSRSSRNQMRFRGRGLHFDGAASRFSCFSEFMRVYSRNSQFEISLARVGDIEFTALHCFDVYCMLYNSTQIVESCDRAFTVWLVGRRIWYWSLSRRSLLHEHWWNWETGRDWNAAAQWGHPTTS